LDVNQQELSSANAAGGTSSSSLHRLSEIQDFSIVQGGPLFQLLFRTHFVGGAMTLVMRRVILFVLITWVPLLLLSAFEGHLFRGSIAVPFLLDLETHIRFLVVVPLLLDAELVVHKRLLPIARTFLERNLIPKEAMKRFDAAVNSAFRLRNSIPAEVLIIALVYAVGVLVVWRRYMVLNTATWYATGSGSALNLSHAGMWYADISLPIFQFLLLRWYFRMFIWMRFLWQVSRIRLALVATHPDRVGGLGFLADTAHAFSILVLAHSALLAGQIANRIIFLGKTLMDFKIEIAVMAGFLMCLVFGPLLVFSPQLGLARHRGLIAYGTLADRYVREFDRKWMRGGVPGGEPLLGSADIQSLADMGNSFSVVNSMQLVPITRNAILQVAAAMLVPLTPLLFTVMSPKELAQRLLHLVF
jgi:hypothetical protein